jgi:hypothetical protein
MEQFLQEKSDLIVIQLRKNDRAMLVDLFSLNIGLSQLS